MKKATYDKVSTKHTLIMALVITALAFSILVSIAGAAQSTNFWFHHGSELMNSGKYNEAIKAYGKATEINPQNSDAWYKKGAALAQLNRFD